MRLLYWRYFFTPPGGWGDTRGLDFTTYWKRRGYQVWVLTSSTYFPQALRARLSRRRVFRTPEGIAILALPTPYHQYQSLYRRIGDLVRFSLFSLYILHRMRHVPLYVVVVSPPPVSLWLAALWRWCYKKPYAVEVTDAWPQVLEGLRIFPRLFWKPIRHLFRWAYARADFLAAYSPDIAQALREVVPTSNTVLSYNGTRLDIFRRRRVPAFLPFRVVYAGTFGRVNGVGFILEVAHALRDWAGIQFWLVGDGYEQAVIAAKAQLLPNVHLHPPLPPAELSWFLHDCHIGVSTVRPIPILASNSASKFYNYLAAGLVVGINYGGWQKVCLERWACGFSATNPAAFAQAILEYYWDRGGWRAAQARARLLAEKYFDRGQLAAQMLQKIVTFASHVRLSVAEASTAGAVVSHLGSQASPSPPAQTA